MADGDGTTMATKIYIGATQQLRLSETSSSSPPVLGELSLMQLQENAGPRIPAGRAQSANPIGSNRFHYFLRQQTLNSPIERQERQLTPYDEVFVPIFLLGCVFAAVASLFAARAKGCMLPSFLITIGIVFFWAAIFLGSDVGYRAWQLMDNPPDEAFSDASVMGALLFGWFPGLLYCLTIFGVVRGIARALRWANPDKYDMVVIPAPKREETNNPYQPPNAGRARR